MDTIPPEPSLSAASVDQRITLGASQENEEVTSSSALGSTPSASATPLASQESPQSEPSTLPPSTVSTATESSNSTSPSATEPAAGQIRNEDLPKLEENQEEVMTSKLLEPIRMYVFIAYIVSRLTSLSTFSQDAEKVREKSRSHIVPESFYRTGYETSITLSDYTSKDTHAKHREEPNLRITAGNAFQAIAKFTIGDDLNRERIERHLIWNKKVNPSCYISTFNELSKFAFLILFEELLTFPAHAVRRAHFHYKRSQRIGHRVYIAEICSDGLVPATVSAKCETTVEIITKNRFMPDTLESRDYVFDVDIPVWIRDPRRPDDRTDLTVDELTALGAEMWISVTELRNSNLKNGPKSRVKASRDYICAKGHDYEWLSCGPIVKSRIIRVMPFDGKVLYEQPTTQIIRSLDSTEPWVWSSDKKKWVLDAALTAIAEWRDVEAHKAREALKRSGGEDLDEDHEPAPKRPKMLEVTLVRPYIKLPSPVKARLLPPGLF
jgi:hypothetical protein